ncbi:ABC transporter substrate-binding protein [Saccharopolyspora gloriosae]|uniref:taurine ABC transporter substrate-binding protein n=1 Tax=Saccharopolyspora gloriosae TaxID=455344 RepID=UPI001FB593EA|nr:ABC transporter substrate-binding protein [Saccharopolyspora gloriosae]
MHFSAARRPLSRRSVFSLFGAAAAVPALAACGVGGETDEEKAKTVRIAYQNFADSTLLVKEQRTLENRFPDHEFEWTAFDSGAGINTAFLGGALDLAVIGSSPAAQAISPPLAVPYQVIQLLNVIGSSEALVVRPDRGIKAIPDLVGRKIAAPFSSTSHYSLLAALQQHGVDPGAVNIVDLEPQNIQAAWERGDIDGAYLWTPTLTGLQKTGTTLIDSAQLAETGKPTLTFAVAGSEFLNRSPQIAAAWLEATDAAIKQIGTDPTVVAQAVSKQIGSSVDDALSQLEQNIYLDLEQQRSPEYFGTPEAPGKLAERLRDTAEFLLAQKKIDALPDLATFQQALRIPEPAHAH